MVEELLTTVKEGFSDTDPVGTLQSLVAALRQCNQDFSRYLMNFTLLSDLVLIMESLKIFHLYSCHSPGMK